MQRIKRARSNHESERVADPLKQQTKQLYLTAIDTGRRPAGRLGQGAERQIA